MILELLNLELMLVGDNNANFKIFLFLPRNVPGGEILASNGFANFELFGEKLCFECFFFFKELFLLVIVFW